MHLKFLPVLPVTNPAPPMIVPIDCAWFDVEQSSCVEAARAATEHRFSLSCCLLCCPFKLQACMGHCAVDIGRLCHQALALPHRLRSARHTDAYNLIYPFLSLSDRSSTGYVLMN